MQSFDPPCYLKTFWPQADLDTLKSYSTYCQYSQFFKRKLPQRPQFKKCEINKNCFYSQLF